jgi:hypothetical protein
MGEKEKTRGPRGVSKNKKEESSGNHSSCYLTT